MLPELPTRQYQWRHHPRRTGSRNVRSSVLRVAPSRRWKVAEWVLVGLIDLALIVALLHPALVRGVLVSATLSSSSTITTSVRI